MEKPHVIWMDNFSKFMARSIPSCDKDIFSTCLWTGVSIFETSLPLDADKVVYDDNQQFVRAMPLNLFEQTSNIINTLQYVNDQSRSYYPQSYVFKYEINSIPLKVRRGQHPDIDQMYESKPHSLHQVMPFDLKDINIGSNRGLAVLMRQLFEEHKMDTSECKRYITINADENIYYRVLKVCIMFIITHIHNNSSIIDLLKYIYK